MIDAFCGNGHEEFSLGFKYCDYFDMRFNYGQGACGCCICYDWGDNNEAILIKPSIDGWWEKISIQWKKYFHELKKELDLRIPDDYLKEFYINPNLDQAMGELASKPLGRYEDLNFGGWVFGIDTKEGVVFHAFYEG